MAPSFTEISTALVKFHNTDGPFWTASMYRFTAFGSGRSRAIMVKDGQAQFASIAEPIYGLEHPFDTEVLTSISATADDTEPGALMTGTVTVREAFYRESTDEYSWAGAPTEELEIGSTPSVVNVHSNSFSFYDRNITHRVFFVKYQTLEVYYEGGRCPYTAESDTEVVGDTCMINVTDKVIINNRELPNQQQTRIFPAVRTACFWKGRVFGACLEPREFAEGTELILTNGGRYVQIAETSEGSGEYPDFFDPSDTYKGIINRDTGEVVAYIECVVDNIAATIRVPGDLEDISLWPNDTVTLDNVALTGDMAKIYATPIYAGGPGGGIIYGIMSFNALDVLEDERFYGSGAKLVKLVNAGDDLAVIYDRGIGFFTGDTSAGAPPTCRHFALAQDVGTLNPDSVWQRPDGSVWFVGNNRLYTIQNGAVVEASKRMGVSALWGKMVEDYGEGQREFQTAYNPGLDMALMVNVPKRGEGTGEFGTFSLAVCHDSNSVQPLRWPVKFSAVGCLQHDDGQFQFYTGAKSGGWLYKALKPGRKSDDYRDGEDTLVEAQPVPWYETFGVKWENGIVQPVGIRLIIETAATDGVNITVEADLKKGNLISAEFVADVSQTITHARVNRGEYVTINKKNGYAVQYKVSGTTARDFTLIGLGVSEEFKPAQGSANDS